MKLEVYGTSQLRGIVSAPGSKSYTHREVIASMLAGGKSVIRNYLDCGDTRATIDACKVLGAEITVRGKLLTVYGTTNLRAGKINCRESGTTLRLITPIAALADGMTEIDAEGALKADRPIEDELEAMRQLGVSCYSENGRPPIRVSGPMRRGGTCKIRGDITSQFISGLMFYLPLTGSDSVIETTTKLKSKDYTEMTREVLGGRGVNVGVVEDDNQCTFYGTFPRQEYQPRSLTIPGDYSSAANLLVAAAITKSPIVVGNLYRDGQADRRILDVLWKAGAKARVGEDHVNTSSTGELHGFDFDATDNPDIITIIAVLAMRSSGVSTIRGVKRLVYKESDRLAAIMDLNRMGGKLELIDDDTLKVCNSELYGAEMDSRRDHRNVMAYAIAGLAADGKTLINNADTDKSYPGFVEDMQKLGAKMIASAD